jgi:hypothetical protein
MGRTVQRKARPDGLTVSKALEGKLKLGVMHPDQAYVLGPHLRAEDKLEVACMSPITAGIAYRLQASLEDAGDTCVSIEDPEGRLHGWFGFSEWTEGPCEACIWLLSDEILFSRYAKIVHRVARDFFFPELLEKYRSIGNFVHISNVVHLAWLRRLGFTVQDYAYVKGELFLLMRLDRNV